MSTLLNIGRLGQTAGIVGKNFPVDPMVGPAAGTAAISSSAPVSASTAPDGLGLSLGGSNG